MGNRETITDELFGEMVALMRRERKRVRNAEFLGPREAAESIDKLRSSFERARDAIGSDNMDLARTILREDLEEDVEDDDG
jgi:hypothetical protein